MPFKSKHAAIDNGEIDAAEIERERKRDLLKKIRVNRDKMIQNRGAVTEGNPAMEYVWVNREATRQNHYRSQGYRVCKDSSVETAWKCADGTHVRGDLILYEIEKETYELLHIDEQMRAVELVEGVQPEFEDRLLERGIPAYHPPES